MAVTWQRISRRFGGGCGSPDVQSTVLHRSTGRGHVTSASPPAVNISLRRRAPAPGAVILAPDIAEAFSGNVLISENPHLCFTQIATLLHPPQTQAPASIRPPASVARPVSRQAPRSVHSPWSRPVPFWGEQVCVGPGCYIGGNVAVGNNTVLAANVVVMPDCAIGNHCLLHAGVVVGSDGFGYARDGEENSSRCRNSGRVVIGDDVEIGANTTIDRGAHGDTVIANGVKLDNRIRSRTTCALASYTAVAGCVGIAGSAVIGRRCTIGGHCAILGHLEIADGVHVTAGSLITNSIPDAGEYSSSLKAEPAELWRRNAARFRHLDELARRLRRLEEALDQRKQEPEN